MAKQTVNIGTSENKGDGDPLRTAFQKINENFDELYTGNFSAETDIKGSVFGDDSTLLVDGANNSIPSSVIQGSEADNWTEAYGWGDHATAGYITTETDPIVGAINGLVKADGAGNISAAVAGTDYLQYAEKVQFTAKNASGSTLEMGTVVYISGLSGNTPEVDRAKADSSSTMPAFGIVQADTLNNNEAIIITFGSCPGHDASIFAETGITFVIGDTLYVSAAEAGKMTNVPPAGESNKIQNIGKVERATPTTNMTLKIGGAGRTNATPALDEGNIFIGDANNRAVTASLATSISTNLKTINGESLVGVGDITISGGGTETDPIVGAVNGIVKADGAGNLAAAVAGTDYSTVLQLNDLSDVNVVDYTSPPDRSGQPLVWDDIDSVWYPGNGLSLTGILHMEDNSFINLRENSYIHFEGSITDGFDTILNVVNPTANRTVRLPDADGTIALLTDLPTDVGDLTDTGGLLGGGGALTGSSLEPTSVSTGDGNDLTLTGGDATEVNSTGGDAIITGGDGALTDGNVLIGTTQTNAITIGGTAGTTISGTLAVSSTATFNNNAIFDAGVQEAFDTLTGSSGVTAMDCDNGHVFYLTGAAGDITANFTNLELTAEYGTNVTVIINQGATPYEVTAVQIGGAAQTINWQGGSAPTGNANGIDSFSFTILNDAGSYVVLGQMVDFT